MPLTAADASFCSSWHRAARRLLALGLTAAAGLVTAAIAAQAVVPAAAPGPTRVAALAGAAAASPATALPPEVDAALARAKLPRDAVSFLVSDADGTQPPRLAWRQQAPMNPASVMKLVTTFAGLDLLGPAFAWRTPVYVDGPVRGDRLDGNLYLQGEGDPKLVLERLWLLLRRVQGLGIRRIGGDIVLDRSAFANAEVDPAAFDSRPLRAYNAGPDALLVNYKSLLIRFTPDRAAQIARIGYEPPLAGVALQDSVPLTPGDCGDWRGQLRADFKPLRIQFAGSYPAGCADGVWPVAYPDPDGFAGRAIAGLWAEMGGQLQGRVRDGRVPDGLQPAFEMQSPPLAEVVRDINKYSNNVMADQLFLTLGLQLGPAGQPATPERAGEVLRRWWAERIGGGEAPPVQDNGSGLSREARISAGALARLLQVAWRSGAMPELMASLPIAGVDGTLRQRPLPGGASAHLKSGSMPEFGVAALAGYVDGASGRRYVLVALANHANAAAARPAFDALVDWAARDRPGRD